MYTTSYSNTSYIIYHKLLDPHVWCPAMEIKFNCFRGEAEKAFEVSCNGPRARMVRARGAEGTEVCGGGVWL